MTFKRRVIIIGNNPIKKDYFWWLNTHRSKMKKFIDESDCVIRMNTVKNYGYNAGTKFDILCILNRGTPFEYFKEKIIYSTKQQNDIKEVWFSRPNKFTSNVLIKNNGQIVLPEDCSEGILFKQKFNEKKIKFIDEKLFSNLCNVINRNSIGEYYHPSTGYCAIHMVLDSERFQNYDIYVFGFSWQGWDGHNWAHEKSEILKFANDKRLFILN